MIKEKNIWFITWMQIVGCLLVIIGHSYPFILPIPLWAEKLRSFIYDFHMPLFVWCSGYLLIATGTIEKYSFLDYIKRRIMHLIVPYILFSLLGIIPKLLLSSVLNDKFEVTDLIRVFLVPRESIWGHFWFLPMIFVLGLIGYGIIKIKLRYFRNTYVYDFTFIAVGAVAYFVPRLTDWLSINDIVHYFIYLYLGIFCGTRKLVDFHSALISVCCFLFSILLFYAMDNSNVAQLLISLLMLYVVFYISQVLSNIVHIDRESIFAQTYSIFILSWPCQLVVEIILERLLKFSFYITFPCEILIGIIAPLLIIKIIDLLEKKIHMNISLMIGR